MARLTAVLLVLAFILSAAQADAQRFRQRQGAPGPQERPATEGVDAATRCAIGRFMQCDINLAIARGLFETGLRPRFPGNAVCRGIDEGYAISYTAKRDREQYHGGIDMPAPWGTPIVAVADGTVVAKYEGAHSFRGIEVVLRHSPEETGIPLWIYTQYAHFSEMPSVAVGERVRRGQVLGPTGNTGIGRTGRQSGRRRPAIHFAVFYSARPDYIDERDRIIPAEGHWMDPVALFRKKLPLDSEAMKALPEAEKEVPISILFDDGRTDPADTKIVWPYTCTLVQ